MSSKPFPVRFFYLVLGLWVYGVGVALMVHASIGIAPWDVFAQGLGLRLGISFGTATIVVSLLVMLMWIPLRVRPGLGTLMNAVLIGVFADLTLYWLPSVDSYLVQLAEFVAGMVIVSFATGLYISTGMGKGPRDGFMVGLASKLNKPFWLIRTLTEVGVVGAGFLLGGQVREGTLLFALAIGYLNQIALQLFGLADKSGRV